MDKNWLRGNMRSMGKKSKKKSQVTFDLPDELIAELVLRGKSSQTSVRQQIREAMYAIAAAARAQKSATSDQGLCNALDPQQSTP